MGPDPPLPFSLAGHLQHGLGVRQEGGTASPLVAQSLSPDSRLHRAPVSGLTGGREQCAASPRLWYLGLLLCPRTTWSGCWQRQPGLVAWPPNFLSFQFQLKIETARTHLVLSDSVGGGRLCRHRPPISGHVIPNPQFPLHMPLLLTASLCWASCCLDSASSENILVGLELGRGRGRATECRQRPNLLGLFLPLLQVKWGLWDKAAGSGTFRVGKGPRSPDREWNPRDPGW